MSKGVCVEEYKFIWRIDDKKMVIYVKLFFYYMGQGNVRIFKQFIQRKILWRN